jgi:putative copper export protein
LVACSVVVFSLILRAWAHTAAVFSLDASLTSNALSTVAMTSRWGQRWQWQCGSAVICCALFAAGGRRFVWLTRIPACVILGATVAMTGHAAGDPMRIAIHGTHVLAAGMWLGTLATLMLVRGAVDESNRRALFDAFSGVALLGAALLVLTGAAASLVYLGALSNLWTTRYGRVLMLKIALAAVAMACGALNWRAIHRQAREPGRAAAIELATAFSIVVVTSLLTELEHP